MRRACLFSPRILASWAYPSTRESAFLSGIRFLLLFGPRFYMAFVFFVLSVLVEEGCMEAACGLV